jgi:hypothetical protein
VLRKPFEERELARRLARAMGDETEDETVPPLPSGDG